MGATGSDIDEHTLEADTNGIHSQVIPGPPIHPRSPLTHLGKLPGQATHAQDKAYRPVTTRNPSPETVGCKLSRRVNA